MSIAGIPSHTPCVSLMWSLRVGPQALSSPARMSKARPAGIRSPHQAQILRSRAARNSSGKRCRVQRGPMIAAVPVGQVVGHRDLHGFPRPFLLISWESGWSVSGGRVTAMAWRNPRSGLSAIVSASFASTRRWRCGLKPVIGPWNRWRPLYACFPLGTARPVGGPTCATRIIPATQWQPAPLSPE